MAPASTSDTDELLDQADSGDRRAVDQLLARHRKWLRRMIALRMDGRIAGRVDPSDVVQEDPTSPADSSYLLRYRAQAAKLSGIKNEPSEQEDTQEAP